MQPTALLYLAAIGLSAAQAQSFDDAVYLSPRDYAAATSLYARAPKGLNIGSLLKPKSKPKPSQPSEPKPSTPSEPSAAGSKPPANTSPPTQNSPKGKAKPKWLVKAVETLPKLKSKKGFKVANDIASKAVGVGCSLNSLAMFFEQNNVALQEASQGIAIGCAVNNVISILKKKSGGSGDAGKDAGKDTGKSQKARRAAIPDPDPEALALAWALAEAEPDADPDADPEAFFDEDFLVARWLEEDFDLY